MLGHLRTGDLHSVHLGESRAAGGSAVSLRL